MMERRRTLLTALSAITLATSTVAFQPASLNNVPSLIRANSRSILRASSSHPQQVQHHGVRQSLSRISMSNSIHSEHQPHKTVKSSLFRKRLSSTYQKLRRVFTILFASIAIFFSSTHIHTPPALASTIAASKPSTSLLSKLNFFRPRTSEELIDKYIRDRLFADDAFDPVESAYREAFADYPLGTEGAYPSLLADTAASALGRKDGSSLILSRGTSTAGESGGNQGITGALIKASDVLQRRLGVSSSVSYYMIAAGLLVGGSVLPGTVGVAYQAIQRLQIDKSEMKMYGKITDIAANAKQVKDKDGDDEEDEGQDDDDDDEEEE